jgi:hypothetical protein
MADLSTPANFPVLCSTVKLISALDFTGFEVSSSHHLSTPFLHSRFTPVTSKEMGDLVVALDSL